MVFEPSSLLGPHPFIAAAYAAAIYGCLWVYASAWTQLRPVQAAATEFNGRFGSIDGLRGMLALGVMIQHSALAYRYFTSGVWDTDNPVIIQVGQTAVAMFFMITGFLFATKAMASRINWAHFFRGRLARLAPLYWLVTAVVFVLAFAFTGFELLEPRGQVAKELLTWVAFAIFGVPAFNGFADTKLLIAGVNWSLKYEVLFYIVGVPALFLFNRVVSPKTNFMLAITSILALIVWRRFNGVPYDDSLFTLHFLGGVLVAYMRTSPKATRAIESKWFHSAAVFAALYLSNRVTNVNGLSVISTIAIFAAFVGNASLLGLLKTKPALWLGDISYGIYLVHGLVLFLTMTLLRQCIDLSQLNLVGYTAIVILIGIATVTLASLSFIGLEMPAMRLVNRRPLQGVEAKTS